MCSWPAAVFLAAPRCQPGQHRCRAQGLDISAHIHAPSGSCFFVVLAPNLMQRIQLVDTFDVGVYTHQVVHGCANVWASSKTLHKCIARLEREATPGNCWGLPVQRAWCIITKHGYGILDGGHACIHRPVRRQLYTQHA